MSTDRTERTPGMDVGDVVVIDWEMARLIIPEPGTWGCGWWEHDPPRFIEEVVYPDGSVDRWENGLPVMPRVST